MRQARQEDIFLQTNKIAYRSQTFNFRCFLALEKKFCDPSHCTQQKTKLSQLTQKATTGLL